MKYPRIVWLGIVAVLLIVAAVAYPKFHATNADAAAGLTTADNTASGGTTPAGIGSPTSIKGGARTPGGGPATAVVTTVAKQQTIPIIKIYVGTVEPIASVAIRPRIDGVVVKEPATEGQTVKQGDLLFQLDEASIQAAIAKDQAAVAKDQATLDQANVDLARQQTLLGHGDVTQQAVDQQQAAAKVAAGTVTGDKAQLQSDQVQLTFTTITAPMAGRIGAINVSEGALIHAADTTPLLTITQMAPVRVTFNAPERDLAAFRQALAANTPSPVNVLDADTGKPLSVGSLTFIDSSVDIASGTVTLKGQFANADTALWPGSYVRVQAQIGSYNNATVVPSSAVQLSDATSFVFLVKPDSIVTKRTVTVADTIGDIAVIASGLQPGDHVVIEGQLRLNEGSRIKEAPQAPVASNASIVVTP
jgi:multidrug efflux system membrane fusion protein